MQGDDLRLEGDQKTSRLHALRHRGRESARFVGRVAAAWIFLAVGALLLAGMVSPQPIAFANTSASVVESFGAANASSGGSSLSALPTAATGAGDLLVAVIRTRNSTLAPVSTVTDSATDSWTRATSKSQGSGDEEIWYAASANSLSTAQSVTVTVGGSAAASTAIAFTVLDVTGAAATSPLDVAATNAASSGTAASTGTTATTTQATEIAIADIAWNTSGVTLSSQTTGYAQLPTQTSKVTSSATGEQGAWHLLSAAGAQSYSATLSASVAWAGAIATFKIGTAPPPTITGLNPTSGPVGTPVTITGTGFTGTSAVKFFNGVSATFTVTDAQHISTSVPATAATGAITVTAPGGPVSSSTFTVTTASHPPHVMLIVDENKDYKAANLPAGNNRYIIGNPQAPYLNQLAGQYASATNWYSLAHPSFKNYLGLLSGATLGNIPHTAPTLVDQLSGAGIPWAAYVEGLNFPGAPSSCDPSATNQEVYDDVSPYFYEWDHNPFWYFNGITGSSECNNVVPYPGSTSLLSTLNGPNPPDYVQISPNGCNDGHDAAPPCQYSETETTDLWLQGATNLEGVTPSLTCPTYCLNLPAILSSSWYQSGGIIIITWDEAPSTDTLGGGLPNTSGGQIATIVISSTAHGAYTSAGNDYGILRAIEEKYGLPLLANAANSANGDLSGAFGSGPSGSISGTVTDSVTNAAVAGASVTCTGTPTCTGTTTDSSGKYTLSSLAPGTYTVQVAATGYGTLSAADTVTTGAAPTDNFSLVPNAGSISGVVTDSVTNAVKSGASVSCTGTPSCTPTSTAGDGSYSLGSLTEGTYHVTVAATNYGSQTIDVTVGPGGTPTKNFALVPNSGTIRGTVTDSNSTAISGASVSCTGTPTCTATTTGTDGTYTLSPLTEGTYQVTVSKSGYATQTIGVTVGPGGTPTQDFSMTTANGSISGTVTDSVTTAAMSGASVSCTGTPACTPTSTAGDGSYSLGSLTEGTYHVTVAATNYGSQTIDVTVGPGGTPTQNFALTPNSGAISGTVTDSVSKAALSGASISCTGTPICSGTSTDINGQYTLSGLVEGTYHLTVSKSGYVTQTSVPVTVTPGTTTTKDFPLVANAGALSVAQSFGAANSAAGNTMTATTSATQTGSGNLLVLAIKTRSASTPVVTVTGITDNASPANVWVRATGVQSGLADEEIWYVPNARSVTSVTVTVSGTTAMAMTVADVIGASTNSPLDQVATSSGNSTALSTGITPITTQSNEIVMGNLGWNGTGTLSGLAFSPQTTMTAPVYQKSTVTSLITWEQMAWQVVTTTHTQNLGGTLSSAFAWTGAIATFH